MNNPSVYTHIHLESHDKVDIKVTTKFNEFLGQKYIVLSVGNNTSLYMTREQADQIAKALWSEIQVLTSPEHAE